MLDLAALPIIDNHCHPNGADSATLDTAQLARVFYHGLGDCPRAGVRDRRWDISDELRYHISNLGVVQTAVCKLARLFDCPTDLAAVAAERNRRTASGFAAYARFLYEDAGIVATVVDSDLTPGDPTLELIPGRILRLFQMDPAVERQLTQSDCYAELLRGYLDELERAVLTNGYVGIKSHLAEQVGFGVDIVSDAAAEAAFPSAKTGNRDAFKRLYTAVFAATVRRCGELDVPVHLHSGITGGLWDGPISNADPFLLAPLLRRPEFMQTRIVLLHAAYPWIQHAALLAHSLPQVWVDIGWTTPWIALRLVECYREVVGAAPLSKLMIGSGGHGTPEIAWLAGRMAKIALAKVLGDAVELGLLVRDQAQRAGRLILHDNAARLYGLPEAGSA